jgi:hypothetical protein
MTTSLLHARAGLHVMGHSARRALAPNFSTTTVDINNSFPLANYAFFCGHPQKDVTLSFPDVFWQGNRLGQHEADVIQRYGGPAGTLITYYIFVDVAREPRLQDRPPQEGYDLRQKPEDLCFVLRGGDGSGRGYKSNTVVIPKDAVAAALAKAPAESEK